MAKWNLTRRRAQEQPETETHETEETKETTQTEPDFATKKPNVAEAALDEENLHLKGDTAAIEQETQENPRNRRLAAHGAPAGEFD